MNPAKITAHSRRGYLLLFAAVLVFFFVSGACGLLYQVVWTRKLVLLFGTTSHAVSTVLTIFFLGLGAGSLWGGRLADRTARPLLVYGIFEVLIGIWALLFLAALAVGEGGVAALLQHFGGGRGAGIVLRALLASALLFVPVALMGATLPLLAKYVNREARVRGFRVGALYTLNTLGAVTGCFLTGFLFLPALGYTQTTWIGAAANLFIGAAAMALGTARPLPAAPEAEAAVPENAPAANPALVTFAFAVSGFCGLALEVLWTRLLAIVFLGTTYAYTTMLGTLLCGIALGSAVGALIADRIQRRAAALGIAMFLTAIGAVWILQDIAAMPEALREVFRETGANWAALVRGKFWMCFRALLFPTFFMGMTFPLAVKALGSARARLGRDVGRIYAANTFGGVLGAIAGGYLLIPTLGTHWGILVLALALACTGALLLLAAPGGGLTRRAVIAVLASGLFAFAWHRAPADVNQALNEGYVWQDHEVLSYREGVEATVTVTQAKDAIGGADRVLMINGVQATASIEKGVKMNRLQGVLPLLFDRDPKTVLFMCFGSGITAGTLALSDFERIDAVEISPDVLAAAPLFEADNLGVLHRDNIRFHIDDGRNYLLTTPNKYDVITFEPMPLALAGVSTFYTREYYELCLAHLEPGGLVSQWVPMHSLDPDLVRSLVRTFTAVFPHYSAWFINADLFLIGSNQPLHIDYKRLAPRLDTPVLRDALVSAGFQDHAEVVASFLLDQAALDAYAEGGRLMTDDHPWAEFIAPKLVYERTVQDTIEEVAKYATPTLSILLRDGLEPAIIARLERRHEARVHDLIGLERYYGGMLLDPSILDAFEQSLEIDPEDNNAKYYMRQIAEALARRMLDWEEYDKAVPMLRRVLAHAPGDNKLRLLLADALHAQGDDEAARAEFEQYKNSGGGEDRSYE